ncbi:MULTISPECIES: hypothetical protein, partial [unclassified Candidatus Cardinium]|uniref:hypothetical protein n=1 Tax=unclassified Candidatus Cardinium TaxID=2641185 RepID=UPI001FB44F4C
TLRKSSSRGNVYPFVSLTPKNLALEVNKLSKDPNRNEDACEQLTKTIANIDLQELESFNGQSLSMLVNGFSKWSRNEIMQQACQK